MLSIARSFDQLGPDISLSPEQWLSVETAKELSGTKRLGDIVRPVSQQAVAPVGSKYVLDTGNAREGFLDISILGDPVSSRTSAKKIAIEGDVIVSRLRPYLRQVAAIPRGASKALGQDRFYCSTEFFVLRGEGEDITGLVAWLLSDPVQRMMTEAACGGHHPRINLEMLLNSPVDDRFLGWDFSVRLGSLLSRHLQDQCALRVLLGH